jgi:hypothetical protein
MRSGIVLSIAGALPLLLGITLCEGILRSGIVMSMAGILNVQYILELQNVRE